MSTNSWQNLPQEPRWTKQRFRGLCLRCCLFFLIIVAASFAITIWKSKVQTQPLQQLIFSTDGTLTESWFIEHVHIPWQKELLSIDLGKLQKNILRFSQIKTCDIQRQFPNTLKLSLIERKPCAKVAIAFKGQRKLFLVDEAGKLFKPINYRKDFVLQLPTLAAIPTHLFSKGRIVGFSAVSELLTFLKNNAPDLLQHAQYISLRHFDPYLEKKWQVVDICLRAKFTIQFPLQSMEEGLKKLKAILRSLSAQQRKSLKKINVALTHPTIEV
jgi:Cell division septal protein